MRKFVLSMTILGVVLLTTIPAMAQVQVPILSPGNNFNDVSADDICATGAQEQALINAPVGSPDSADIRNSCNDVFNVNDRDTTTRNDNDVTPTLDTSQEADSGDLDMASTNSIEGNNNIQCSSDQQLGATGNTLNGQGLQTTQGGFEEAELNGTTSETAPEQPTECAPSLGQSAATS